LATEEKLWTWGRPTPADAPGHYWVELNVGDATLALTPAEVVGGVRALLPG
jgi:hypothetical protein